MNAIHEWKRSLITGKETIVDGEKYGSMHGNSDRNFQKKLLPYRRQLFLKYV